LRDQVGGQVLSRVRPAPCSSVSSIGCTPNAFSCFSPVISGS